MSKSMSLDQIRIEGWQALTERLGPAGAMRFMMQYNRGHGDYTEERRAIFADVTIEDLFPGINVGDHSEKPG
jgi:extradiol dioxygenase family protein